MNANVKVHLWTDVDVLYFNCTDCGTPLLDEKARSLGWCGCVGGDQLSAVSDQLSAKVDQRKFNSVETSAKKAAGGRKSRKRSSEDELQRRIDAVVAAAREKEMALVADVPCSS